MFAVGLILVVLALIVVVYVMFATGGLEPMSIDWGIFTADLTPLQLFFLGAITIVVMAIGLVMLSFGLKKQGEKRAEVKRLRKEVKKGQDDQPRGEVDDRGAAAEETMAMDKSSTKNSDSASTLPAQGSGDSTRRMGTQSSQSGPTGPVQSRRAGSGSTATGGSSSGGSTSGGTSSETGTAPPPPRR